MGSPINHRRKLSLPSTVMSEKVLKFQTKRGERRKEFEKHGEYVSKGHQKGDSLYCPFCGSSMTWWRGSPFCPRCGWREGCCD